MQAAGKHGAGPLRQGSGQGARVSRTARWPSSTARDGSPTTPKRATRSPQSRASPCVTPCSPPSRRGLATAEPAAPAQRLPSLTATARGVTEPKQVGTKKRPPDRTKKPDQKEQKKARRTTIGLT